MGDEAGRGVRDVDWGRSGYVCLGERENSYTWSLWRGMKGLRIRGMTFSTVNVLPTMRHGMYIQIRATPLLPGRQTSSRRSETTDSSQAVTRAKYFDASHAGVVEFKTLMVQGGLCYHPFVDLWISSPSPRKSLASFHVGVSRSARALSHDSPFPAVTTWLSWILIMPESASHQPSTCR